MYGKVKLPEKATEDCALCVHAGGRVVWKDDDWRVIAVDDADSNLGKRLLQDLALKALLEGHPDLAMKLLPENAPADNARKLLSDLRALALGEGKVETWPATATESRPPRGVEPLIPTDARPKWQPPSKEKPADNLSNLDRAEKVAATLKAQAIKNATGEKASSEARAAKALAALSALHDRIMVPELAERKQLVAVEAVLDRRLLPAERVRVQTLLAQKKSPREIAEELKAPPAETDEEKEFLAEVERRLGQALTEEQIPQAKRLRKQGRTSAEVADIIRR